MKHTGMHTRHVSPFSLSGPFHYATALALTTALLLTWNPAPAVASENCAQLLTSRCEVCHYTTRVCQKVRRNKGKSSWKRTIRNMVKQGAKLTKAEQKQLISCLSKPTPEVREFCKK